VGWKGVRVWVAQGVEVGDRPCQPALQSSVGVWGCGLAVLSRILSHVSSMRQLQQLMCRIAAFLASTSSGEQLVVGETDCREVWV
jgi:hypothetical protein